MANFSINDYDTLVSSLTGTEKIEVGNNVAAKTYTTPDNLSDFVRAQIIAENASIERFIRTEQQAIDDGFFTVVNTDELHFDPGYNYVFDTASFTTEKVFRKTGAGSVVFSGTALGISTINSTTSTKNVFEMDADGTIAFLDLVLVATTAPQLFDITNLTSSVASLFFVNKVIINGAKKLGSVDSSRPFMPNNSFNVYDFGFDFKDCSDISIRETGFTAFNNASGCISIRLTSPFNKKTSYTEFQNVAFKSRPNEAQIDIDSGFNYDIINATNFVDTPSSGLGTGGPFFATGSLTQDDVGIRFRSSTVQDSKAKIVSRVENNTLITDTLGSTTPIIINASWAEQSGTSRFTSTVAGRLTHTDVIPNDVNVFVNCELDVQGGSDRPWQLMIYKNGSEESAFTVSFELSSGFTANQVLFASLLMETNDYIELFLKEVDTGGSANTHRVVVTNAKFIVF